MLSALGVDVEQQRGAQKAERERRQRLAYEQAVDSLQRNTDPRTGRYMDAHDRLGKVLIGSIAGIQRKAGRRSAPKARAVTGKYAAIIAGLKKLGVSLLPPFNVKRRDAIERVLRRQLKGKADGVSAETLIRYLRRHPEHYASEI